jgi:hypothetical protein
MIKIGFIPTYLSYKARYVLDLETHSHKLSTLHKQLYLFQKHQLGVLTDYYEKPAFDVPAPTNLVVNYYDLVNIFFTPFLPFLSHPDSFSL